LYATESSLGGLLSSSEPGKLWINPDTCEGEINGYDGIGNNLEDRFDGEISHFSSAWEWIQDRIQSGNFKGIQPFGDYIQFTDADSNIFVMEIAGIDTYYRYGDTLVPHHIDFISLNCHPTPRQFNKADYNNGTSVSPNPWLASDLYAWLNSLSMSVPNSAAANPALTTVNYSATGVYNKLPAELKAVIVEKRVMLPRRYSAGNLLIDDNGWDWRNAGKLWIPSEVEVNGAPVWGSNTAPNNGNEGGFMQYPIFANKMKRVKGGVNSGSRFSWWLLSTRGSISSAFSYVASYGHITSQVATHSTINFPICFRIA